MNPIERAISIFAPYDCVVCEYEGKPLCLECADLLPAQPSVCFICGQAVSNYKTCTKCLTKNKPLHVWTFAIYKDQVRNIIKEYKFNEKRALAKNLAELLEQTIPFFAEVPLVTYVPTASSHVRQRGFDQAKYLAKELAKLRGWPFAQLLARQTKTRQLGAKRDARKAQLKGAFRTVNQNEVENKHILIVDDVVTTGATLEVCSKELYKAGALRVDGAVFARTPKGKK